MGLGYAWEKTMVAVTGMAASPASIHDRIVSAYVGSLIHIRPEEDLPEDLRPLLADIKAAMTATPATGDEGRAMASARAMSMDQATDVANKIVQLYDSVSAARMAAERDR